MDREAYFQLLEGVGKLATAFLDDIEATLEELLYEELPKYQERISRKHSTALAEKVQEVAGAVPPPGLESLHQDVYQACTLLRRACDAFCHPFQPHESILAVRGAHRELTDARRYLYQRRRDIPGFAAYWVTPDERHNLDRIEPQALSSPEVPVGLLYRNWEPEPPRYALYVPEYYEPARAWPMIVSLHGGGGQDTDNIWLWLRYAKSKGYILVAPKALDFTWMFSDARFVMAAIAEVRSRYRVAEDAVFLTGVSDGGTFTYEFGLTNPDVFAALAPVCGALVPWPWHDFARARHLPVYILHGALDRVIPVEYGRQAKELLEKIGFRVTYRELPHWGHSRPYSRIGEIGAFFEEVRRTGSGGPGS